MNLLRLQHERAHQGEGAFHVGMPDMFAGSSLDLEENTAVSPNITPAIAAMRPTWAHWNPASRCPIMASRS
jgi:hypothetical protein